MSQITTIVFDIGKVLAAYGWERYLSGIVSEPEVYRAVEQAVFLSPTWVEHDKGLVDEEQEILDFVANAPEYETEIRAVYENLGECVWKLDYALPWVQELKEMGYRVYALSNWPKHIYDQRGDKLDFLPLMDGAFLSFREHLIKPDEKAFLRLTEMFQIIPEETVFLDDNEENIRVAKKLGFHGIRFQTQEQAKQELARLGVA